MKTDSTQVDQSKVYLELSKIDVNDKIKKANGFSYLSWAWAWDKIMSLHPDAEYEIERFGEGRVPYIYDENLGYMVFTNVTIGGIKREMWLPVMDSTNRAMKKEEYHYDTRSGRRTVAAATMFDINKTIMRCLVKNLAMFGLGLYIYAGEDLPEGAEKPQATTSSVDLSFLKAA